MSDHGPHYGPYSNTEFGTFEHRNALMIMLAPKRHLTSVELRALSANQQELVSAFDFYETLKGVPSLSCLRSSVKQHGMPHAGRSLFDELPHPRSCADAGIPAQWCVDTIFEQRSTTLSQSEQEMLIGAVLDELATRTIEVKAQCRWLRIEDFRVVSALVLPGSELGEADTVQDVSLEAHLVIENVTTAGDGRPEALTFQATCVYFLHTERVESLKVTWVTRKSQYRHENCDVPAHLKQFCVCQS